MIGKRFALKEDLSPDQGRGINQNLSDAVRRQAARACRRRAAIAVRTSPSYGPGPPDFISNSQPFRRNAVNGPLFRDSFQAPETHAFDDTGRSVQRTNQLPVAAHLF